MSVYDNNKDGRLSKQQAMAMGYGIYNGQVNDREIQLYWRDYKLKLNNN